MGTVSLKICITLHNQKGNNREHSPNSQNQKMSTLAFLRTIGHGKGWKSKALLWKICFDSALTGWTTSSAVAQGFNVDQPLPSGLFPENTRRQGGRCHPQLLIFTTQNNFSHFSTNFYQQKLGLKCYMKQQSQEQQPKYSISVLSVDIKTFFFCYYSVFTLENIPQNTICMEQIPERLKTTVIPGACCLPARAPCW